MKNKPKRNIKVKILIRFIYFQDEPSTDQHPSSQVRQRVPQPRPHHYFNVQKWEGAIKLHQPTLED